MKTCLILVVTFFISFGAAATDAKAPLSIEVQGGGTISGQANGNLLEIGKEYRLVARPGRHQIFLNWQNNTQIVGYDPALKFEMQDGLILKAVFGPNPYQNIAGTYQGFLSNKKYLLAPGGIFGPIEQSVEGYAAVDLNLSRNGTFTGKVYLGFETYSFSGKLRWQTESNATATVNLNTSDPQTSWFSQSGVNINLAFDPVNRRFDGHIWGIQQHTDVQPDNGLSLGCFRATLSNRSRSTCGGSV